MCQIVTEPGRQAGDILFVLDVDSNIRNSMQQWCGVVPNDGIANPLDDDRKMEKYDIDYSLFA